MKTVEEAIIAIETSAAAPELRQEPARIGEVLMQGDVFLTRVPKSWPRGKLLGTRQIAVGTNVGSRHIVEGDVKVYEGMKLPDDFKLPEGAQIEDMLGPVVEAGSETILTHPEHAHHALAEGCYQVTYQWDAQTMARVRD
jgi:hypothetical protein